MMPAPIYVVTAQEIRERGYPTLKDVMKDVPGFVDLSDTNENTAGVRGVYASTTNTILILVDGHRMNSFSLGRYNTDQYFGLDTVERIELIQGPGSVLYGTGQYWGVETGLQKDLTGMVRLTASSAQVSDPIAGEDSVEGWTRLDFATLCFTKRFELPAPG